MRKIVAIIIIGVLFLGLLFPAPYADQIGNLDWYDIDWKYCKPIVIDHNQVGSGLTNFPILVYIESDSDLASKAQSD